MHNDSEQVLPELAPAQRAQLYRVLAQLALYEADASLQSELNRLELGPLFEALAPGCKAWLSAPLEGAEVERLACLYAELFLLGKDSLPLQASHWLGDAPSKVRAIEALVRQAEPEQVAGLGNLAPDHLGVLLCYVASAYDSASAETQALAPELDRQLLGDWPQSFAVALAKRTKEPLYQALSALLLLLLMPEDARA